LKYLFAILLIYWIAPVYSQITYETVYVDYDSAWQYKNLKIIPIRAKKASHGGSSQSDLPNIISLNQALSQGIANVTERGTASTENVHWLRINNSSDKSILISSGELIAGGRQDRIIMRDTILAPSRRDQYVPVMCVEEGRWSEKEKKFAYDNFANNHLRRTLEIGKNQVLIWKEINSQLEQGGVASNTMAYLSLKSDKKMVQMNDEYFQFFRDKFKNTDSTIVGIVCISGNKIIGSDIFAGTRLFYGQLEPLLRGYIDDAVFFGKPVNLPDKPVKDYMDKILTDERSQQEFVSKNGKIFMQFGRVIHISTF
jgi:hypothetical protein